MSLLRSPEPATVDRVTAPVPTEGPVSGRGLPGGFLKARRRPLDATVTWAMRLSAWVSIAITVGILVALALPAIDFFRQVFGTYEEPTWI